MRKSLGDWTTSGNPPESARELAMMAKRRGQHADAAAIWLEIADDPRDGVHACEQLAIYYERHARDRVKAAQFAKLAIATLGQQRADSRDPFLTARFARMEHKFLRRLARLAKKTPLSSPERPQVRRRLRGQRPIQFFGESVKGFARRTFHGHAFVPRQSRNTPPCGVSKEKKFGRRNRFVRSEYFFSSASEYCPKNRTHALRYPGADAHQDKLLRLFLLEDRVTVAVPG